MTLYGTIADVSTTNLGENLTAAAILGATTLSVTYPPTFDEAGGQVLINGEIYSYTGIDADLGTITLASGLLAAADDDDRVEIYPARPVKVAMVEFDVDETDALPITVPHAMKDVLADGMREPGAGESVLIEERSSGEQYIADVLAAPANTQASELTGDGYPPGESPNPVVTGFVGALHAHWTAIENPDPVTYKVHLSTVNDFTPDETTLVAETGATSITIRNTPDDLVLTYGTDYHVKIVASDLDGDAPASFQGTAQMVPVTGPDIAANYVYAGQVSASQIVGGEISGDVIYGGKLATALSGARVEQDASGLTIYDSAGEPTTDLNTDSTSVFRGDVEAGGLTVNDSMSIRGTNNEIAQAAKLELASGATSVSAPSTAPSVVQDWQSIAFTKSGDASFNPANLTSMHWVAASSQWVCGYRDGSNYKVYRFNSSGTYLGEAADSISSSTAAQSTMFSLADLAVDRVYTVASNGTILRHRALTDTIFDFDNFTSSVSSGRWITRVNTTWDSGGGGRASLANNGRMDTDWVYDMNEAYVSAKVDIHNLPNDGMYARMELYHTNNNEMAMIFVKGESGGQTLYFRQWDPIANETSGTESITYNSTTHKWWKIAERSGVFYFYTSADGDSWTERYSNPHTISSVDLESTQIEFQTDDSGEVGNVEMYVDSFEHGENNDSTSWSYSRINTSQTPTIGNDGTNLLIAEHDAVNDKIRIQTVSPSTGAVLSTFLSDTQAQFTGPLAGVMKGNFDFGASRFVVKAVGSTDWWVLDGTTAVFQSSQAFPADGGGSKGIGWDGSNFYGLGTNGQRYKHTTGLLAGSYLAGYTWYDSNATGGTHETTISPLNSFTLKRRARVTITSAAIPPGGGTDDPNSIRIYAGTSSGAMKLQGSPGTGATSYQTDAITTGGAAPPGSNGFGGSATPGKIVNPSSSLEISGDGTIKATALVMSPYPGSQVQTRFTSGGSYSKPAGAKQFRIQVQAGGGAGGGAAAAGAGGQGGGYAESLVDAASLSASTTVTVGSGGTGVSAGTGNTGGTSSFGSLVSATGGVGGQATAASANVGFQESGDSAQTLVGNIQVEGGGGVPGGRLGGTDNVGGTGGPSFLGTGGRGRVGSNTGSAGHEYGGGGGGSANSGTQSARVGGAGAPGIVIVTAIF
jgi:hypothetical protein